MPSTFTWTRTPSGPCALQHLSYAVLPPADAGRIGEVGPGPWYGENGSIELGSGSTKRNTTFMA